MKKQNFLFAAFVATAGAAIAGGLADAITGTEEISPVVTDNGNNWIIPVVIIGLIALAAAGSQACWTKLTQQTWTQCFLDPASLNITKTSARFAKHFRWKDMPPAMPLRSWEQTILRCHHGFSVQPVERVCGLTSRPVFPGGGRIWNFSHGQRCNAGSKAFELIRHRFGNF